MAKAWYGFVEPGRDLPEGATVVENPTLEAEVRDEYGAMAWASSEENRQMFGHLCVLFGQDKTPSAARMRTERYRELCERYGPREGRTRLVKFPG